MNIPNQSQRRRNALETLRVVEQCTELGLISTKSCVEYRANVEKYHLNRSTVGGGNMLIDPVHERQIFLILEKLPEDDPDKPSKKWLNQTRERLRRPGR